MKVLGIRPAAVGMLLAVGLALPGCKGLPQVEFPQIELPQFDLPHVELPQLPIPQPASFEQVMAQRRAVRTPVLTSGLKHAGTLTVGIRSSATAPLLIESSNGHVEGLNIELACSLADDLGLDVTFVRASEVSAALEQRCDVVMGVSATEADGFDVVGDYADSAIALFRKGDAQVVSADQIAGKTIGLQDGSASQEALHATALTFVEATFATLNEAFEALEEGTVDYVACHAASGAFLASRYENLSLAGVLNTPVAEGFALSSGEGEVSVALRESIARLEANGVLGETRRRWMGDFPVLTPALLISDIPQPETPVDAADGSEAEDVSVPALDGSTAGANAAVLSADRSGY